MTDAQKHLFFWAWAWCDHEDKSTEFMIQYMSDIADIEYGDVVGYIEQLSPERDQWYKDNPEWLVNNPSEL